MSVNHSRATSVNHYRATFVNQSKSNSTKLRTNIITQVSDTILDMHYL